MFAFLKRAIGSLIGSGGVDVPITLCAWERIDLPPEQIAVKLPGALEIVGWDFKPDNACSLFLL